MIGMEHTSGGTLQLLPELAQDLLVTAVEGPCPLKDAWQWNLS